MMSFLNPGFLWFLLLGAPVIAVYFIRSRPTRRPVSSNLIWRIVHERLKSNSFLQRFQQSLLLLLQLLVITVAVLATARPSAPGWGGLNRIIILDVSTSMQAADGSPTRFDEALARARRLASGFGGRISLYQLSNHLEALVSPVDDHGLVVQALTRVKPGHTATPHPDRVLRMIRDLEGLAPDEIFLLTDTLSLDVPPDFMPQTAFSVETFGKSGKNVALVEGEGSFQADTGQLQGTVTVLNRNTQVVSVQLKPKSGDLPGFPINLAVSAMSRQAVALPAVQQSNLEIVLVTDQTLNANPADDFWYFCDPGLRPQVLLDTPADSPLRRLDKAFPFLDVIPYQPGASYPEALAWIGTRPPPPGEPNRPACIFSAGPESVLPGEILPYPPEHPLLRYADWDSFPVAALGSGDFPGLPLVRTIRGSLFSEDSLDQDGIKVPTLYLGLDPDHAELRDSLVLPVLMYNVMEYLLKDSFPRVSYPVAHPSVIRMWQGRPPRQAGIFSPPGGKGNSVALNLQAPSEANIDPAGQRVPSRVQTVGRDLKEQAASPWESFLCVAVIFVLGEWYVFLRRH